MQIDELEEQKDELVDGAIVTVDDAVDVLIDEYVSGHIPNATHSQSRVKEVAEEIDVDGKDIARTIVKELQHVPNIVTRKVPDWDESFDSYEDGLESVLDAADLHGERASETSSVISKVIRQFDEDNPNGVKQDANDLVGEQVFDV